MCRRGNVSQALLWNSIESGNAENTVAGEQVEKKERKKRDREREREREKERKGLDSAKAGRKTIESRKLEA